MADGIVKIATALRITICTSCARRYFRVAPALAQEQNYLPRSGGMVVPDPSLNDAQTATGKSLSNAARRAPIERSLLPTGDSTICDPTLSKMVFLASSILKIAR